MADKVAVRPPPGSTKKGPIREYAEAVIVALAVALMLRFFVIEAFKIPSGSMIETLAIGDFIFVNKLSYGAQIPFSFLGVGLPGGGTELMRWDEPSRGDVAVFRWPGNQKIDYIKRLVAVGGDTVEVRANELYLNGEKAPRKFVRTVTFYDKTCREQSGRLYSERIDDREYNVILGRGNGGGFQNFGPIKVKDGHVFAMGDNRDHSSDSRDWGQVDIRNVKGRALFAWLSIDPCAGLSGKLRVRRIGLPVR